VVVPDGPGADADEAGEFSDPHASRRHLDAATRSNGARLEDTVAFILRGCAP
jgi:hypothetical protein